MAVFFGYSNSQIRGL